MRSPRSSRSWTRPTTPPAPIPTTRRAKPRPRTRPSAGDAMPNSMARLLLLLPTTTYRTQAFVDAATRLGVDLVCASERPSTLEERAPDNLITVDFADPDGAAETLARFARRRRIAAILARDDVGLSGELVEALLVEEFIPGREVALEGLLTAGGLQTLALFDKPDPLDGPFFEETIYVTPSRLPAATQARIADVTLRACAALGLTEGPVHAELRVNDAGPWVVEVAARSIGGLCSRTLRFGTGMTLEELILRHALGWKIDSFDRERRAAGVMMIPIPRAGRLVAVRGQDAAEAVTGVEEIAITAHVGQEVVPLPEGWQYLGFIFARGDAPEEVEQALRRAHARLAFEIA